VRRDALGRFKHEAACVDPVEGRVYLTEDVGDGGFYRFTPTAYPDLSAGKLEIATVATSGAVTWTAVPNPIPGDGEAPTRTQVPGSTKFDRGEGIWYDAGIVYVATTNDETVHAYDVAKRSISILYRQGDIPESPLKGVDNVTVSQSGDVYVCEDSYDNDPDAMDVCIITREGEVARFVKLTGAEHFLPGIAQSEITGVCFSPNGQRMYFSSQRAGGPGALYEVTGPFRLDRPGGAAVSNASAVVGSAIGVEAAPKAAISLLTGAGVPIALTLDSPTKVKAKLLEAKPKGGAKPKVIAKGSAQLGRGRGQLTLKVKGRKPRQELRRRRRPLNAVLEVKVGGAKTRRKIKLTV
jgi:secreted PhoX family phosphatase